MYVKSARPYHQLKTHKGLCFTCELETCSGKPVGFVWYFAKCGGSHGLCNWLPTYQRKWIGEVKDEDTDHR